MNPYDLWAQQQYGASSTPEPFALMGSNFSAPSAAAPLFTPPSAPQNWGDAVMQQANGGGFNFGANAMAGLPQINTMDKPGIMGSMLGPNGWGGMALSAAGGLASTFLGMKQYGLAKQTLAENKRQFQMNYDAQKQTTNTRMEDRQAARVASNPGGYQSVGDYMAKNRIA